MRYLKNNIIRFFLLLTTIGIIVPGESKVFAAEKNIEPSFGVNVSQIVSIIMIIVIVVAILMLIYSIYRIIKLKRTRKILYTLLTIILIVTVVFNVALSNFSLLVNTYFIGSQVDEVLAAEAKEDAQILTEKIQSEGIVMLKNRDDSLPLKKGNINIFGYTSRDVIYGGSGAGGGAEDNNINLQTGLKNAGYNINDELTDFYDEKYVPRAEIDIHKLVGGDFNIHEPSTTEYSDELIESAKNFSDTALVVFSRNSGEGADITTDMKGLTGGTEGKHYLELADNEEALLNMVKENFNKVIVIINSSNVLELGFLDDEGIDGALWIGGPGSVGFNAVGKVLSGEENPSGRTVDTYAYDVMSAPSYYNIGEFPYENSDFEFGEDKWHFKYIDYAEGIYVGYRYYETRYVDNETGEIDEEAYNESIQFPFGYGLSYTNFTQEIVDYKVNDSNVELEVKVTNTGDVAGKEVIQIYYTPPYKVGGIEKSHVELIGFDKTDELMPGEDQILEINFPIEDMASYDYIEEQSYVLESGDYEIKLMANAHDIIDSEIYSVETTIVYDENNKRESDEKVATNHFDHALGEVIYLTRADWEGTMPKEVAQPKEASKELLDALHDHSVKGDKNDEPIVVKKHGLSLYEMKGLDYDDPEWDKLLEQLSVKDMEKLITNGGFQTPAINSVKKPATIDTDGPAGINHLVSQANGNQYTSQVVVASTWNVDLAKSMGETLANEATAFNITGLYLPGVNIHRSPFSGRNFEYYSEDPYLSGKMGANLSAGAMEIGSYVFMKHFAMYDMETKRYEYPTGAATWSNEQSMREIYLKPFEMAVKEANITGIMSSYNRIGPTWVGESHELLKDVLRDEWGFKGTVISDFYKPQYMDIDAGLAAGNDLILFLLPTQIESSTETNWGQQNMRKASHNILYTVVNSHAFEVAQTNFPKWIYLLIMIDLTLLSLLLMGYMKVTNSKKIMRKKALKEADIASDS